MNCVDNGVNEKNRNKLISQYFFGKFQKQKEICFSLLLITFLKMKSVLCTNELLLLLLRKGLMSTSLNRLSFPVSFLMSVFFPTPLLPTTMILLKMMVCSLSCDISFKYLYNDDTLYSTKLYKLLKYSFEIYIL